MMIAALYLFVFLTRSRNNSDLYWWYSMQQPCIPSLILVLTVFKKHPTLHFSINSHNNCEISGFLCMATYLLLATMLTCSYLYYQTKLILIKKYNKHFQSYFCIKSFYCKLAKFNIIRRITAHIDRVAWSQPFYIKHRSKRSS